MSRLHALAATVASVVLAASLHGCSSSSGDAPAPGESGTPESTEATVADLRVRAKVSRVQGQLSQRRQRKLTDNLEHVLRGYLVAAYLHGRAGDGYRGSFPPFTKDARELAVRDAAITSDAAYAGADEVRPSGAAAFLSVVAPDGRPVGITARVFLDLDVTEKDRTRRLSLTGRLLLTPEDGRWRIFGYDLSLEPAARGRRNR